LLAPDTANSAKPAASNSSTGLRNRLIARCDEVSRRAEVVLGSGRGVILDATFRSRELRPAVPGPDGPAWAALPLRGDGM
jgi:hypothetical protein